MIHVPRTAGTSLTSAIYGHFLGHFSITSLLAVAPIAVLALPRFAIVRNPWDRLVSAWSFARQGYGNGEATDTGPSPSSRDLVRIRHPELYRGPDFATFDSFVLEWFAHRDVRRLDGVFKPQTDYVLAADGSMPFNHLGRIEKLDETIGWLSSQLGRTIALPRFNSSDRDEYRQYYTAQTRDLVARIYARDIAAFGYTF